jgi:hypothetical protein
VINSPEVWFEIQRQYANLIIFSYQNYLCRSCRNGKTFLEKDLFHNFVQFLAKQLFMT